jgi:alpha-tubulin suppressor-like RCC1 family protein
MRPFHRPRSSFDPLMLARVAFLGCSTLAVAGTSQAATTQELAPCRVAVSEDTQRYVSRVTKILAGCHDGRVKGKLSAGTDCNDVASAAAALGKSLPSEVLDGDIGDPGKACDLFTPSDAGYNSCPSPCESITVSSWADVDSCMQCVTQAHLEEFVSSALGQPTLPLDRDSKTCARALIRGASTMIQTFLDANTRCVDDEDSRNECLTFREDGRIRIARVRSKVATKVTRHCADADFASIGSCATAYGNAGCVLAEAQEAGMLLAYDARRMIGEKVPHTAPVFVAVTTSSSAACGIRTDGAVECWTDEGLAVPSPPGRFARLSSAGDSGWSDERACGIHLDGSIDCWPLDHGYFDQNEFETAPGAFVRITSSANRSCAIRTNGTIACWGFYADAPTPPAGTFLEIATEGTQFCAIRSDATVQCWGSGAAVASPPSGTFTHIAVGFEFACGIRTDQTIECWGSNTNGTTTAPPGTFTQIEASESGVCALATDSTVHCWGLVPAPPSGTAIHMDLGPGRICVVRSSGDVECVTPIESTLWPDRDQYTKVSNGRFNDCAIRTDGTIGCRGYPPLLLSPPSGSFVEIDVGDDHACGIRSDHTVECWGDDSEGEATAPPGTFTQLSAGEDYNCGVRTDQSAFCWGTDFYNLLSPPPGAFTQMETGDYFACGLHTDSSVECWGSDGDGWTEPPAIEFASISTAPDHSCGLTPAGWVECWGTNDHEANAAPFEHGPYVKLETGGGGINNEGATTCALRPEGTLDCWPYGYSVPPPGVYSDISTEGGVNCGIRGDGEWICWTIYPY